MSDYSDRLDAIRKRRDRCYAKTPVEVRDALPQLHRDCYWLLDIVDAYDEESEYSKWEMVE